MQITSFCLICLCLFGNAFGNSRNVQVIVLSQEDYTVILRQIICMATCADTSILLGFFHVSTVITSLICHFTVKFLCIRMTSFPSCNEYNKLNTS